MVATTGPDWQLAPSLVALFNEADKLAPDRPTASDGSIGDSDHQARTSDHNPHVMFGGRYYVTAGDLTDWDPRFDVDGWLEHMRQRRDPRIKYAISDGRFFSSYAKSTRQAWAWAPYDGPNGHFAHIHISVLPTSVGLFNTDPWFSSPRELAGMEDDSMLYKCDTNNDGKPETYQVLGGRILVVPGPDTDDVKANIGQDVVAEITPKMHAIYVKAFGPPVRP